MRWNFPPLVCDQCTLLQCSLLLMLGISFQGMSASNIWAITQTLAGPYAAGRWTGLQNFVGNLAGSLWPRHSQGLFWIALGTSIGPLRF
jgi:hypothetical protein